MRFSGQIGIRREPIEVEPGRFIPVIDEITITGKVITQRARFSGASISQDTASVNQVVSFILPEALIDTFNSIVYVVWQRKKWSVSNVEYLRPRVNVTFGGLYNEP